MDPIVGRDMSITWNGEEITRVQGTPVDMGNFPTETLMQHMGLPKELLGYPVVQVENREMAISYADSIRININGEYADHGRVEYNAPTYDDREYVESNAVVNIILPNYSKEGLHPLVTVKNLQEQCANLDRCLKDALTMQNGGWPARNNDVATPLIREMCIALWQGDIDAALPLIDMVLDQNSVMDHIIREIKRRETERDEAKNVAWAAGLQSLALMRENDKLKAENSDMLRALNDARSRNEEMHEQNEIQRYVGSRNDD